MMNYYELKNIKTGEMVALNAQNFLRACEQAGWKPLDTRCIYKCPV